MGSSQHNVSFGLSASVRPFSSSSSEGGEDGKGEGDIQTGEDGVEKTEVDPVSENTNAEVENDEDRVLRNIKTRRKRASKEKESTALEPKIANPPIRVHYGSKAGKNPVEACSSTVPV